MSTVDGDLLIAHHEVLAKLQVELERLRNQTQALVIQVGAGGAELDRWVEDWPAPGLRGWTLSNRRSRGNDGLSIPAGTTTATDILPGNVGRIGGSIVNSGANAATLYLCEAARFGKGVGAIWLSASGGSWDLRLSNVLWKGPVSATAVTATTLIWAEV